jgi:hypothetical protein
MSTCNMLDLETLGSQPSTLQKTHGTLLRIFSSYEWAHMDLNLAKCAITKAPTKPNSNLPSSKHTYKSKESHTKEDNSQSQHKPYTYLGIQLVPSLKWHLQKDITINKAKQQSKLLIASQATIRQINQNLEHHYHTRNCIHKLWSAISKLGIRKIDIV